MVDIEVIEEDATPVEDARQDKDETVEEGIEQIEGIEDMGEDDFLAEYDAAIEDEANRDPNEGWWSWFWTWVIVVLVIALAVWAWRRNPQK